MSDPLAVIAIGGNALIPDPEHLSIADQYRTVRRIAVYLAEIAARGWNLLVTHGNGPQVGFILRRSELSLPHVDPVEMDYAGADVQGAVGYMFCKALRNAFVGRGVAREPVALVTQTLVSRSDKAFSHPTKPIGAWFDQPTAERLAANNGWQIVEDSGRGWRRVVASPTPLAVLETEAIRGLLERGHVVIALGGGGIPVVQNEAGFFEGIEAVIDKDAASALLARQLGASLLLLSTGVERVALRYNTPHPYWLDQLTVSEAKALCASGEFAAGSMEPKIRALTDFVESGGKTGIITDPEHMVEAIEGKGGTRLFPDTV